MAAAKAQSGSEALPSYLNGYTGKVTSLTEVGGQMFFKSVPVTFTRDVVFLPDSEKPPRSLLGRFAIGDSLHYNAILTASLQMPSSVMYIATKVWMATVKSKVPSPPTPPVASTPTVGTNINAKLIVKIIKAILQKNGSSINISQLAAYFENASTEIRNVYGDNAVGLKKFIVERPKKFVFNTNTNIVTAYNNIGTVQKQTVSGAEDPTKQQKLNKPLVKKTINTVKNLLRIHGNLPVATLFVLTTACDDDDLHNFIGTEEGFRTFLAIHTADFVLLPNGTVSCTCRKANKPKAAASTNTSANKCGKQEMSAVTYYKTLVQQSGSISIENAVIMLNSNLLPEVRQTIGSTPKAVQDFFRRHTDTFLLKPDNKVYLAPKVTKQPTVPKKEGHPKAPSAVSAEDHRRLVVQSIDFLKYVLDIKGPLPINKLVGHMSNTSPEIRKFISGSPAVLATFLKSHSDVFVVSRSNVVHRADQMEQVVDGTPAKDRQLPTYNRGIVLHVSPKFGFIQNGSIDYENIFFDVAAFMQGEKGHNATVTDLQPAFTVGDMVDCLYVDSTKEKKCKYRAVAVWKITSADEHDAPMVSLVSTLSSPVLYGEVRITFLDADVGYCVVEGSDLDSLIEFEGKFKVKPALVVFHMKHVSYPKALCNHLKMGSRVKFIACWKSSSKDAGMEYWSVVSMWPSSGQHSRIDDGVGMHWVAAKIWEMTNEGGELSFGNDPWKHRISFNWEYLLANSVFNKVVTARVSDKYWCIIKNRGTMGDTKWVAIKMHPCNDDNPSQPPSEFSSFLHVSAFDQELTESSNLLLTDLPVISSATIAGPSPASLPCPKQDDQKSKSPDMLQRRDSETSSTTSNHSDSVDFLIDLLDLNVNVTNLPKPVVTPPSSGEVSLRDYVPLFKDASNQETNMMSIISGTGTIISRDPYGGQLETENKQVVYFGAHSFYLNEKPVTHYLFDANMVVNFDAKRSGGGDDSLIATKVWIGKKPV